MAQPVYPINISPWHLVAAAIASHILFRDRLIDIVGHRLNSIVEMVYAASKSVVLESPVTILAAGLTYGVDQLTTYAPALALSTAGSMKAAAFVGGIFVLKSALSPALEKVTEPDPLKHVTHATMIGNSVIRQFFPLVLGTAYAFYAQVPVKLAQSALYTAALIPVIKLLGKGIDSFCEMEGVKERIQSWYAWMMGLPEEKPDLEKLGSTSEVLS
jgi:hypothetical protein